MLRSALSRVLLSVASITTLAGLPTSGQSASASSSQPRTLTFEDRVAAQRAIEEVYWRHRIWPKDNPQPKPSLDAVMPDAAIRTKVEDYLKLSNALETWWQRPMVPEQLQAELKRMTTQTRDSVVLKELFEVLANDATLIAETLGRETIVARLIRNWYAFDDRFHRHVRRQAEEELAGTTVAGMKALGGQYREQTFVRQQDGVRSLDVAPEIGMVELDTFEWREWIEELEARFGAAPGELPVQRVSGLQEDAERFVALSILSASADRVVVASVSWPKRTFDAWWAEAREEVPVEVEAGFGAFEAVAPIGEGCVDDTWSQRFYVPVGRSGHTAVWTGSEMIVWGGMDDYGYLDSGARYSPSTDSWVATSIAANGPDARRMHTAIWTGTEMIVWGGFGGDYLNTGWRFNPSTDTWTPTSTGAEVPSARDAHTAVWTGTEMIVWGGSDGAVQLDTGGRYDPAADKWTEMTSGPNLPEARAEHTAVWTGSRMIVWGGYHTVSLNTGAMYDPATDCWVPTSTGANVPASRSLHTAVWTGSEMIVWGGRVYFAMNTGGRYDPVTDSWTATSTGANVPRARYDHTAVWTGAAMIIWGGFFDQPPYLNTGGNYDPESDTWAASSTGANVPQARSEHTAVWTGGEMIVWGGNGLDMHLVTGGRYDPVSDRWTPTSTGVDVPSARFYHAAIWTGAEMIVWGGYGPLSTGARYDPATDSWSSVSTSGSVPTARYSHTAVWTGTEMVIWGGYPLSNTGGRYNPTANTWASTSTGTNVPTARSHHTAVWTGTEMIIWGGYNFVLLNTGGKYNPAENTWTTASTVSNVPTARYDHTAVWTGTEMIVWGGSAGGPLLDTGGRYHPTTNAWIATSSSGNQPTPRIGHTAVWTGTEMIVWGGGGSGYLNTGGRYSPTSNAWVATTSATANPPEARSQHTAVWTGAHMIIWGGYGVLAYLQTGGRYDPAFDSWWATSTEANRRKARARHTAIWTGTQMIVWGGAPKDNDLYFYCDTGCNPIPDADGDSIGESCDNCVNVANTDQSDGDGDTVGDVCDNCPTVSNPDQFDTDADGIGDVCEGCVLLTVYRDGDGDDYGAPTPSFQACTAPPGYAPDAGDCNDINAFIHPGATETCNSIDDDCDSAIDDGILAPIGALELRASKDAGTTLTWTTVANGTGYDVVTGGLSTLLMTGLFWAATFECLRDDSPATSMTVDDDAPLSDGLWYLVRPINCGGHGTYDSGSPAQTSGRDDGIAGSGVDCP